MFKVDEFCTLCFQIIHVLSFSPNPVRFFCQIWSCASHMRAYQSFPHPFYFPPINTNPNPTLSPNRSPATTIQAPPSPSLEPPFTTTTTILAVILNHHRRHRGPQPTPPSSPSIKTITGVSFKHNRLRHYLSRLIRAPMTGVSQILTHLLPLSSDRSLIRSVCLSLSC
ncbi:hypothetical protein Hanom_Chr16g01475171 [Helianthus anomalus]